ncbi:MAG TPA: type II secretion system F family protein [Burkholderiales bacterium]|nr:type II secretion system F family protein [Burkholderiales bacterium]
MHFRIRAVNASQDVVAIDVNAQSEPFAIEAAQKVGLSVLSVERLGLALPARRARFATTLFSVELMSLLEAGLNLVEALQTLGTQENAGERHVVVTGILASIHRGESFSQAVSRYPQHFSPLYVATVKASEQTGNVHEALSRYVAYREEIDRVRKKVIAASIYPAILCAVGVLVLAFLLLYVVPRFAQAYEDVSGSLPFFSAVLLALGRGVREYAFEIALAGTSCVGLAIWGVAQVSVRAWIHQQLWRAPIVGEHMKVYQLARLYRTVGMLLRAGLPLVQALAMVRDLLATHLRPRLERARSLIQQGQSLSSAFAATGLVTPVAARMMLVGERSGEMAGMLGQIARFHDEQTARYVEWFTRAFEPLLMAALGVAVGLVVVLMYMPVFELAGSIR